MTSSTSESDDDLESTRRSRPSRSSASSKQNGKRRADQRPSPAVSTNMSDDSDMNDGAEVYQKFKKRKSVARSKAVKAGRKAKAAENSRNKASSSKTATGVGRQVKSNKQEREKVHPDLSSDEDIMEWTVPDYLKDRRSVFQERMNALKGGGLRLPPSFEDIYFSDDEVHRLSNLREKPTFTNIEPSRSYEDVCLPLSLGIIPAPIAQWLRPYQIDGVAFLHEAFVYQKGVILGDDMGLGKTIQVIAFLTAAFGKTGDERDSKRMRKMRRGRSVDQWYPRVLIICPGSLMANWQDEFKRWGWWHTGLFHGTGSQKEDLLESAVSGRVEVVITTYHTYRNSRSRLNMIAWDCVVADECHIIKERKSEITQAMNEINALCRIGLTGTALQNKYEEFWTLLNWTNPGQLGPVSTWKTTISEPLKMGQSHEATVYQLARARKTAAKLVNNLLPNFFLRRMKSLIADQLPKKTDRVVFCPLTETQSSAYSNFLEGEVVQYIKGSAEMCECGSCKKAGWCCFMNLDDGSRWQTHVFPAIQSLQKLSNHLALLIPQSNDPQDRQAKELSTLQVAMPDGWPDLYKERDNIINYANVEFCGKWRIIKKLLKFWQDEDVGNKVLVFSHSIRLLRMLQMLFTHTTYNVAYLDGSMKYEDRYAAVTDFNTDPTQFVFLISTRAGGVGLNITSANKVIVVDPNWNPSYDLQAQDRAYRIGQARDVEVFRLISEGTIEEVIYARQIYKQQQAQIEYSDSKQRRYFVGVQGRPEQRGEIFGLDNLFAYQDENVVLRDIVNKTNIAESRAGLKITGIEIKQEDNSDEELGREADDDLAASFDGEKEDSAMSQLVERITEESQSKGRKCKNANTRSTKANAVQAILAGAGVSYFHNNDEVIGASKTEAALSKRAEEAAQYKQDQMEKVFLGESQSQRQRTSGGSSTHRSVINDNSCAQSRPIKYQYKPSFPVKKRQFCTMASWQGYDDPIEFALLVESWTQAERRDVLERFYQWRREVIDTGDAKPGRNDSLTEMLPSLIRSDPATPSKPVKNEMRSSPLSKEVIRLDESDDDEL